MLDQREHNLAPKHDLLHIRKFPDTICHPLRMANDRVVCHLRHLSCLRVVGDLRGMLRLK